MVTSFLFPGNEPNRRIPPKLRLDKLRVNYYTVKQIEEMVYPVRIHMVWQEGNYTCIQLEGGLVSNPNPTVDNRHNDAIKGASVRPRIKIRNF